MKQVDLFPVEDLERRCVGCGIMFAENTDHEYCSPACYESHSMVEDGYFDSEYCSNDDWLTDLEERQ